MSNPHPKDNSPRQDNGATPPHLPKVPVPHPAIAIAGHARHPSDVTLKGSGSLYALRFPESKESLKDMSRGEHPPNAQPRPPHKTTDFLLDDWPSMWTVFLLILVSESARGLILPSLWPYLRSMGGSESTLGIAIASFSLGRMVATVPLGYLSDNFSMKVVLMTASLVQALGHLLYMFATNVQALIAARALVGLGSATMSVCRAHVTRATTKHQRTYFFAYLSALQFVGFAVLPAVGGLTDYIPEISVFNGLLLFDEMTYPAFFLVVANMAVVLVVIVRYNNPPEVLNLRPAAIQPQVSRPRYGAVQPLTLPLHSPQVDPDWIALLVCLFINVCFRGVVAELETITTPVLMDHFELTLPRASLYIGLLGFVGLGVFLGFKPISRRFSDRSLIFMSLAMIVTGGALLYQPFYRLPLGLYLVGLSLIWSLAYPLGQTAILGLFSKVLAGLPVGGFLGLFSASGSLARVGFAVLAGVIWGQLGRKAVFLQICLYSCLTGVVGAFYYKRLVPPV